MPNALLARTLGVLTAAYGGYTLVRPASLARAVQVESRTGPVSSAATALGRLIGTRDLLSGTAMVRATRGASLRTAIAIRVACDLADSVVLSLAAPAGNRPKVLAITLGWAAVCATSAIGAGTKT